MGRTFKETTSKDGQACKKILLKMGPKPTRKMLLRMVETCKKILLKMDQNNKEDASKDG